jgi:hypothetical protein
VTKKIIEHFDTIVQSYFQTPKKFEILSLADLSGLTNKAGAYLSVEHLSGPFEGRLTQRKKVL